MLINVRTRIILDHRIPSILNVLEKQNLYFKLVWAQTKQLKITLTRGIVLVNNILIWRCISSLHATVQRPVDTFILQINILNNCTVLCCSDLLRPTILMVILSWFCLLLKHKIQYLHSLTRKGQMVWLLNALLDSHCHNWQCREETQSRGGQTQAPHDQLLVCDSALMYLVKSKFGKL